ncbi:MAG: alkaline phosphatase [Gammaproteobacteria bacterium HGW-Gammaproteobacteria-3]|nr:MAG: alkaline phosphatase [Gammaproteobacteria bacterium HGW-Gammaproteobacteria-3]
MRIIPRFSVYFLICFFLVACSSVTNPEEQNPPQVKNVILIIGDGMGPQQVGLLLSYARQAPHSVLPTRTTAFDRLLEHGRLGLSLTHAANALVTDSAASASQLATGYPAGAEMIGLDEFGNARENIVETAQRLGKMTGLVSDTRITHATPAAFAAHQSHRSLENEIAEDLLHTGPDVLFSGGLNNWLPQQANDKKSAIYRQLSSLIGSGIGFSSQRKDDKNLLELAQKQGYTLAFTKRQMQQAQDKTLGLFAASAMQNGIVETQSKNNPERTEPTLAEMAASALDILSKNNRGFFLMIEGGQIDWAGHKNDTGLLLHEMLRFNAMLEQVLDWAKKRDDTLIIVTADHETGGFGFSYSAHDIPAPRALPGAFFADKVLFKPSFNFGNPETLDKLYAQKMSYTDIFTHFDALPKNQQTPSRLAEWVNQNTAFAISETQAEKILATESNPLYRKGHPLFGAKRIPKMAVNSSFFVYQSDNRENLLAQAVATSQQAVWSTGTHTSTPVYLFVQGPKPSLKAFSKILHHTDVGRLAIEALQ